MMNLKQLLGIGDRTFYRALVNLSIPIVLQQALSSLLFLLDNLMIGRLGEAQIAALGVANQFVFLMQIFVMGVTSGATIFMAQYWGKRDLINLRRVQGIALLCVSVVSIGFAAIATFAGHFVIGLFSPDPAVIEYGRQYMQIVGVSYVLQAVSLCYGSVLRSCEKAWLPMISAAIAVLVNGVLNYILIFGKLGLPALGVRGAAIATLIAAAADVCIVLGVSYAKQNVAAATLRDMRFNAKLVSAYARVSLPVFANEAFWSIGFVLFTKLYGMLGTQELAAMTIYNTVEKMGFVFFIGMGAGGGVILGNAIGEGKLDRAAVYAKRLLTLSVGMGLFVGVLSLIGAAPFSRLFAVSDTVRVMIIQVIVASAFTSVIRSCNYTLIIGILRPGGDTVFSMFIDSGIIWLISLPCIFIAGLILKWPLWACYLSIIPGDLLKLALAARRIRKGVWARDVTRLAQN